MKKIGILTGGGDCPGLNAVIRAVVKKSKKYNWEIIGIRNGWKGLINGEMELLTDYTVSGILPKGGTIIGTSRTNPFKNENDVNKVLENIKKFGIYAIVAVGGDDTLSVAKNFHEMNIPIVGIPKTIDKDLEKTVITFGFDTAVSFATLCLDRLHSTAEAHRRVMVVEVMGRYAGWIALNGGIAGTADVILIPEIPYDITKVVAKIKEREKKKRSFSIVVVAEGAHPSGGSVSVVENVTGRAERLGGVGERVAHEIQTLTGKETRLVVLGHLLRGGSPTQFDRLLSLRFGAAAIRALSEGKTDVMVALDPPYVRYVPLEQVSRRIKTVPLNSDTILTGRDLGISFGD